MIVHESHRAKAISIVSVNLVLYFIKKTKIRTLITPKIDENNQKPKESREGDLESEEVRKQSQILIINIAKSKKVERIRSEGKEEI